MSSLVAVATTKQDRPISAIAPSSSTGSMRSSPGGGSLRDFSSKPFTDLASGAVDIERSATLLRVRSAGTRGPRSAARGPAGARGHGAAVPALAGAGALLLQVQQRGKDPAGLRRRAVGAEATGLVGR